MSAATAEPASAAACRACGAPAAIASLTVAYGLALPSSSRAALWLTRPAYSATASAPGRNQLAYSMRSRHETRRTRAQRGALTLGAMLPAAACSRAAAALCNSRRLL